MLQRLQLSDYLVFCCFRAMTLSLLHVVVNWEVFTINMHCVLKNDTDIAHYNINWFC